MEMHKIGNALQEKAALEQQIAQLVSDFMQKNDHLDKYYLSILAETKSNGFKKELPKIELNSQIK